ncbi:hypothetical protein KKG31_00700 [Patescibacteria group bacterium]|nr:hypothetical protein [Patescibacteria group bacterium]MBU1757704.1 hypothetical protein [Patescibacteria group bacterium]
MDNYFVVLEGIEDDVEDLQDELMDNPTNSTLSKIQKLKQDLITLRKSIWPVREIINALLKLDSNLLSDDLQTYLKDLYDHTIQVIDAIETFKDIIGGSLDIYLSSLSNKLNEVMKVLTIIGTIFIPLTFVTGFFGMNFKFMMVIDHPFLLPIVIASMCMIAFGMLVYFRRKKWI